MISILKYTWVLLVYTVWDTQFCLRAQPVSLIPIGLASRFRQTTIYFFLSGSSPWNTEISCALGYTAVGTDYACIAEPNIWLAGIELWYRLFFDAVSDRSHWGPSAATGCHMEESEEICRWGTDSPIIISVGRWAAIPLQLRLRLYHGSIISQTQKWNQEDLRGGRVIIL